MVRTDSNSQAQNDVIWPSLHTGVGLGSVNVELLRNLMEWSRSTDAASSSASQQFHRTSHNQNVHYRANKSHPPTFKLSETNTFLTLTSYFFKLYFNIALHLRLGTASCLFPSGFLHQNRVCTFLSLYNSRTHARTPARLREMTESLQ